MLNHHIFILFSSFHVELKTTRRPQRQSIHGLEMFAAETSSETPFVLKTVANFNLIYRTKIHPNKKFAFQFTSSNKINWAYYGISYTMLVSTIFSSFPLFFGRRCETEKSELRRIAGGNGFNDCSRLV